MGVVGNFFGALRARLELRAARDKAVLNELMNYNAATRGSRASSFRAVSTDADAAAAYRSRLSWVTRDMIRNNPFAVKAQAVIAGAVVGAGIVYKVRAADGKSRLPGKEVQRLLRQHLETTAIDADGRNNIYGLQRLAMMAIVQDGEVLIRRRYRLRREGVTIPLQLQLLESDYLDDSKDGPGSDGGYIRQGIEFSRNGQRAAYWLFDEHPGADGFRSALGMQSRRVPASEIIHVYRQDRPGQNRGVSWFAPVALQLQDMMNYQEAQVLRQKIAACFVAFRTRPDGESIASSDPMQVATLSPGRIQTVEPGEQIVFGKPPEVSGYSEFSREVLQSVAAGIGITYAALTGDLSRTNFSSGRLGRIEMDQNIEAWQWLMLLPQMLDPVARWVIEALNDLPRATPPFTLQWVPPARFVADPSREMRAWIDMISAGLVSRQEVIRRLGYDPEDVLAEQIEDRDAEVRAGLQFTTTTTPEPTQPDDPGVIGDRGNEGQEA